MAKTQRPPLKADLHDLKDIGGGLIYPTNDLDFSVISDRVAGQPQFSQAIEDIVQHGNYGLMRSVILQSLVDLLAEASEAALHDQA